MASNRNTNAQKVIIIIIIIIIIIAFVIIIIITNILKENFSIIFCAIFSAPAVLYLSLRSSEI